MCAGFSQMLRIFTGNETGANALESDEKISVVESMKIDDKKQIKNILMWNEREKEKRNGAKK